MINKKGSTLIWGLVIIFVSILVAIGLGLWVFGFNLTNEMIGQDIDLGNGVNLKDISDATFGQINTGLIENADMIGVVLLFGMCLFMMLNGYYLGEKYPKIFIVVDFFLLIMFYIPAAYVSSAYETFINSTEILAPTFINIIPNTSKFVLRLPIITGTVGILTMILTYSKLGKNKSGDFAVQQY